jgi:hypothetical protein
MKTLEVRMGYVLGIALPVLETLRRRANFNPLAMYVDDYIAGVLLLIAALGVTLGRNWGLPALIGAWGIVVGGMYSSFFAQVHNPATHDISGLSNWIVVTVKGVVFAIAIFCFARAVLRASRSKLVAT